jgi:hypothetical protein
MSEPGFEWIEWSRKKLFVNHFRLKVIFYWPTVLLLLSSVVSLTATFGNSGEPCAMLTIKIKQAKLHWR